MALGAVFPQLDPATEPGAVAEWARAAEEAGYDYAVAFDHVFGADPDHAGVLRDPAERTRHEPLVLFAYMAAVTRRLHFLTGVLVLPPRPLRCAPWTPTTPRVRSRPSTPTRRT